MEGPSFGSSGPWSYVGLPSGLRAALYVELWWATVRPDPRRVRLAAPLLRRALSGAALGHQPVPWSLAGLPFGQLCRALRGAVLGQRMPRSMEDPFSAFVPRSTWSYAGPSLRPGPSRVPRTAVAPRSTWSFTGPMCPGPWRARLSAHPGLARRGAVWANARPGPWRAFRSACGGRAPRSGPPGVLRGPPAPQSAAVAAAQLFAAIRRTVYIMAVENLRDFLRDAGVPPNCPDPRAWVEEVAVLCEKSDVWHAQAARARPRCSPVPSRTGHRRRARR